MMWFLYDMIYFSIFPWHNLRTRRKITLYFSNYCTIFLTSPIYIAIYKCKGKVFNCLSKQIATIMEIIFQTYTYLLPDGASCGHCAPVVSSGARVALGHLLPILSPLASITDLHVQMHRFFFREKIDAHVYRYPTRLRKGWLKNFNTKSQQSSRHDVTYHWCLGPRAHRHPHSPQRRLRRPLGVDLVVLRRPRPFLLPRRPPTVLTIGFAGAAAATVGIPPVAAVKRRRSHAGVHELQSRRHRRRRRR